MTSTEARALLTRFVMNFVERWFRIAVLVGLAYVMLCEYRQLTWMQSIAETLAAGK